MHVLAHRRDQSVAPHLSRLVVAAFIDCILNSEGRIQDGLNPVLLNSLAGSDEILICEIYDAFGLLQIRQVYVWPIGKVSKCPMGVDIRLACQKQRLVGSLTLLANAGRVPRERVAPCGQRRLVPAPPASR